MSRLRRRLPVSQRKYRFVASYIDERIHTDIPMQLENYLIEHVEPAVEVSTSTQTDVFANTELRKTYVPGKSGVDASTQVRFNCI